jgi:hypothetical protein
MNCVICNGTEFHNTGLHKAGTLQICKTCGAVSHAKPKEDEAKVLEFYRKEYRPCPTSMNLITTGNKLNYIIKFLADFIKDKKGLVCCDVGAATGYLPNWLRRMGHKATGTEYTTTFRRFSEHFYGIPLTEEIDKKRKYDLITIYHVAEHMVDPVAKLKEYRECLTDTGRIMVSIPLMGKFLDDSSGAYQSKFDDVYHPNHIHALTDTAAKNMFSVAGLEIEKADLATYGQTYLLKKGEATAPVVENWEEVLKTLTAMKAASDLLMKGRFKEAADVYPLCPEAVIGHIMQTCGKDPVRQADEWEAIRNTPLWTYDKVMGAYAGWLMQQDRRVEADKAFTDCINMRPSGDMLFFKAQNLAIMGHHQQALPLFVKAAEMMPHRWQSMMDWACKMASNIPNWEESAVAEVKEALYKQNAHAVKVEPMDAVMAEVAE